jgi:type II secretory pathway pseudopilin PulG
MTLVEMLTAIGVIAILIAMLVLGINFVSARAKQDKTRMILQNLRSMLSEFEVKGGRKNVIDEPFAKLNNKWWVVTPITMPGSAGERGANLIGDPEAWKDDHPSFTNTYTVVNALRSIPSNATIIENLPPELKVKVVRPFVKARQEYIVMPIDAWGNPILYAPRRAPPWPDPNASSAADPAKRPPEIDWKWGITGLNSSTGPRDIQPSDGQGLWISAGPDGDYSTHDDNLYSNAIP